MSGTSLIILAMYATVNVASSAAGRLASGAVPTLLALLGAAALLTVTALFLAGSGTPRRRVAAGPFIPAVRRMSKIAPPRRPR